MVHHGGTPNVSFHARMSEGGPYCGCSDRRQSERSPARWKASGGVSDALVIASNRLPVQSDGSGGQRPADGGLVRALEPLADHITTWMGTWPADSVGPSCHGTARHRGTLQPVRLRAELAESFYQGYANRTLWPWLHDDHPRTEHQSGWWSAYEQVNRMFARSLAQTSPHGATVWVHDYHLMLVPQALRHLRADLQIGFFLHTPFPASNASLPGSELRPLVRGLLGADLIGFQTAADVEHFRRLMPACAPGRRPGGIGAHSLGPSLVARPASIDAERFKALAAHPQTLARAAALRAELGGRRIVLGADRLDYTKAIPARLAGYESLLRVGLVDAAEVAFAQVAVPSRSEIGTYATERQDVESIARRINLQFGPPLAEHQGQAVRLLTEPLPVEELVAYYLAADVLVACPRRDGMNLVAKEYCAAHPEGRGALVLSAGAGAARELAGAIVVSEVTPNAIALAVHHALRMEPTEAVRRMRHMHEHVMGHDAHRWAEGLLEEIRSAADRRCAGEASVRPTTLRSAATSSSAGR